MAQCKDNCLSLVSMHYFLTLCFTDFFICMINTNFSTGYHILYMQENKRTYNTSSYSSSKKVISQQVNREIINNSNEYREASSSYNQPNQQNRVTTSRTINGGGNNINQTSSKYIVNSNRAHQNGIQYRNGEEYNRNIHRNVQFENQDKLIINGQTEFATLKHTKDLLLSLLNEFNSNNRVVFEGDHKEDFSKRLLMLEHQLEGTMRRGLFLNSNDPSGIHRTIDYSKLLNQKENQLCDKDRKIGNYDEKLRLEAERILKLQFQLQNLTNLVAQKNSQIGQLRRQLQIRSSALDKIKSQPNISNSHEIKQILKFLKIEEQGNSPNNGIKTHLAQLEKQISKLKSKESSLTELQNSLQTIIIALPRNSILKNKLQSGQLRRKEDEKVKIMQDKFAIASNLYRNQIQLLARQNPGLNITSDTTILDKLRSSNTKVNISINGVVQIQKEVKVTKQVSVQDARTKFLINALLLHVRKINEKYPKLKGQMDARLTQFLSDEMLDAIQVDSLDNIIQIVKYVPQMVKVQNVYTYSSQKNRKAQFHLRVLIKALLEEMQKVKIQKGIVFEIDQGVIGMIRAEIMDLVEVDDILKIYRPVPKIIQVPKIIEKIVDNIVRVPQKYVTNQLNTQAISLQKPFMAVDEKALIVQAFQPVPLYRQKAVELMSHTSKVVSHPELNQRVAIEVREKTKLQPEERFVERIVEVQKPVIVEKDKIVIQKELQTVQVIKQVVRYLETQREVVKQIQVFVEKIVEKVIEKEKIVCVPQIVEKIVQVIRYEKIPEIVPHIQTRIQIVKQYIEKIVPIYHVEEKIIQVPQIVQKIVTVQKIIQKPPKQIEIIKQVLKVVKQIQIVEVQIPKIIYETRVEIRQVQKYIEVPVIVPQVRVQTQIHQVPFIETVQIQRHVPVEVVKHVIMIEEKPVQVIRNVPFIMKEQVPVLVKEQRVVNQQIYFQKIKEVPTIKEKIIERLVQVPKIVEVQKIVEKIVVVPRIIQRIVQVPQIIQKIVEKIVQVPIHMPPEIHYIPQYMNIQVPKEIQCQKIVYITVDRPVEVPSDQIMVKDIETRTNVQIQQVYKERVVIQRQQVPVEMHIDKIITVPYEKKEVQFVQKVIYQPIECPVPVYLEKTVPVYINTQTVHVEPVTQIVQKIIQKNHTKYEAQIIPQIQERVIVQKKTEFKQIPKIYIQKQIQQVERFEEKIIAINTTIQQIRQIPYYIEKLVPVIQEIPKIFQFEKQPKVIFTPPTMQIVQRIVPKIINVNKYIERLVQKLIEVPHLLKEVEVIKERHEKNIPGPQKVSTNMKTVNLEVEKEMIRQKQKIIQTRVNCLQQTLKVITQVMQRQRDPVLITQDRIIQIPYVMQKICEKIVIMPQVVEVLKYVHQLIDNDINLSVDVDISVQAQQYKRIGQDLQKGFSQFLAELNKIKSLQPSAASRISLIQQYLAKFRRFIKYPKIHEIIREKVVEKEKDRIVKVPMQKSETQVRQQLAKVLLIQKLIAEISRIKRSHPQINLQLEDDINFIFRLNFDGKIRDINSKLTSQLKQFEHSLDKKFSKMGGWTKNHQLMLKSFLEERFVLANIVKSANQQIKTTKKVNEDLAADNLKMRGILDETISVLIQNKNMMPSIMSSLNRDNQSITMAFSMLTKRFDDIIDKHNHIQNENYEPTRYLGKRFIQDLMGSVLRQKQKEIQLLKQKLRTGKYRQNYNAESNLIIKNLEYQVNSLTNQLNQMGHNNMSNKNIQTLQNEIERLNRIIKEKSTIKTTQIRNMESQISRLKIIIDQGNNHNQCNSMQRALQLQNNRLKKEIQSLLLKLQMAQKEIAYLKERQRQYQSPKRTIGTSGSISPRQKEEGRRSIVISHVERASEGQEYGENYQQYMNGENINLGVIGNGSIQGYNSGITMEGKDLAGSAATYRSGHTGHTITSSHYIRPNITHNVNVVQSGESSRNINDRQGTQYSVNQIGTTGTSGMKKYSYYQKKYEQK